MTEAVQVANITSTVGITATEPFPTSIRGHTMGFISAWSKAGAAIGTQVGSVVTNSD
jgi:hypothetical protein